MAGKKNTAEKKQAAIIPPVNKKNFFLLQKVLLFAIAFALYANSIHNGFNMDDEYYTTVYNKTVDKGIKAIPEIFTTHTIHDNGNIYEYRPVAMLSFVLQHQFINGDAETSHFINVLLYALTCLLVFLLLCKWFPNTDNWFSFFICLLFILHPLHTEVVDSIKSRDEGLALFFTMLSLLTAWKWHETGKKGYAILFPILFFIALLSKITVTPYILVLPLSLYFFGGLSLKKSMYYALPLIVCIIAYVCIQYSLPPTIRVFTKEENPLLLPGVPYNVWSATSLYVLGKYLLLHFWPYPLLFFYGYEYIPLVNWGNAWSIISLVLYIGIIVFIVKNFRKKSVAVFAAIFYIVVIYPFSNLVAPVPGLIGERYTYSSSLAFCIIVCYVLSRLFKINIADFKASKQTNYFAGTVIAIGVLYTCTTLARNTDWQDKQTLYTHDLQYLQKSAKANMLYGDLMLLDGIRCQKEAMGNADSTAYYFEEAKTALQRVITIVPDYGKAYNNLAIVSYKQDSFSEAKTYFQQALKNAPDDREIVYNLGRTYIHLGRIDSGLFLYGSVLKKDSSYAPAYKDISETLLKNKDTVTAIRVLSSAIRRVPNVQYAYTTLASILLGRGDIATAVQYCEKAAELPPANINVYNFLEKYFKTQNDTAKINYYQQKINQYNSQAGSAQ